MIKSVFSSRIFLWLLLGAPLAWISYRYYVGELFYGEVIHVSGELSARILMLTMAVTPLRLFFSNAIWPNWLLHRRRDLGIAAFAYAALHTIVYVDRKDDLGEIVAEATEFAMWSGWLAFAIFLALALTSNDASVRWLRRRWKKLHRWIYLAALLSFAHWIFSAFDVVPGVIHFVIILVLEMYRLWKRRAMKRRKVD